MAMQMKTIKEKMGTVANIRKVTKAMEMVSTSKMKRVLERREKSLAFSEEARNLLINLHHYHHVDHPFFSPGKGEKILVLVIASNRGLCGAYNTNVDREFSRIVEKYGRERVEAVGIGKEAQRIVLRNGVPLLANFEEFSDIYEADEVRSLLLFILESFSTNQYERILITYTEFINSLSFQPRTRSLVPLELNEFNREFLEEDARSYVFEPSKTEVLNYVVDYVLLTILYQYLLESLSSEHSSRVMAMRNASDNAKEMLEELVISFNRARQASITQEIAEIVGALSALSS